MTVVGADTVEQATGGEVVVGADDVVTPLARDRAAELGIRIVRASHVPHVALAQRPPDDPGPPSGALFRRGGPVARAVAAPGVRVVPSVPAG